MWKVSGLEQSLHAHHIQPEIELNLLKRSGYSGIESPHGVVWVGGSLLVVER